MCTQYKMLEQLLEQGKAVYQVLGADPRTSVHKLRWQDTEIIELIMGALKPVAEFTNALSAEKLVPVSCLRPILDHLNTEAFVENEEDTTLKKDIQHKIKQYMSSKYDVDITKKFNSLHGCYLSSTFLVKLLYYREQNNFTEKIITEGKL